GPFLPLDVITRTLGLAEAAATAAASLAGEAAEAIEAFIDGVNGRIESAPPGPEFDVLGYTPEPWRVLDSMAIEFFVGFALAMENLEAKLVLARALGALGIERGRWLHPHPVPLEALDAERLAAYRDLDASLLTALAALGVGSGGSNAWAVAPRRSASGA